MNRRDFIQTLVALSVTPSLSACCLARRPVPVPEIPQDKVVIDVHAHIFNAADIPVDGFIEYVALSELKIPGVAALMAILVQAIADVGAPRFGEERDRLDILLGPKVRLFEAQEKWMREDKAREERYRKAINSAIEKIREKERTKAASASEQEFLERLYEELELDWKSLGPVDWYERAEKAIGVISRYLVWGLKLLRFRYQQVEDIEKLYARVDLFTPALVDFDLWFARQAEKIEEQQLLATRVPIDQQMQLMVLIARWSRGTVHSYVAYDPRRDVEKDGQAFEWVRKAVEEQGAIGVKLYPPMGFVALGNTDLSFCNSADRELGEKLDRALMQLYRYCETEEIPVIAHAADTNYNGRCDAYDGRAAPEYWARVLEKCPGLRLNLGHFGTHALPGGDWSRVMRDLMLSYDHVYADLSHVEEIDDSRYLTKFFAGLEKFFGEDPAIRKRLQQRMLYGSDWIMVAKEKVGDAYFNTMVGEYGARLGELALDQFVGGNSVSFLGLADGKNRTRLERFYYAWNMPEPDWMHKLEGTV